MKIVGDSDLCKSRALHTQTPGQRLIPVHSGLWPLRQRLAESGRSRGSRERTHFASWAPASTETTNSQPAASYQRDSLLLSKQWIQVVTHFVLQIILSWEHVLKVTMAVPWKLRTFNIHGNSSFKNCSPKVVLLWHRCEAPLSERSYLRA